MMIKFACSNYTINEFVQCTLGLSKSEFKLFNFILNLDEELSAQEISKKIKLDRTTVQKGLKRLVEKNVVVRLQQNLEKGGYIFIYKIKDKHVLKNEMIKILKRWYEKTEETIMDW